MRLRRVLARALAAVIGLVLLYVAAVVGLGLAYRVVTPVSTLMLGRWATLREAARIAVPLEAVAAAVPLAVVASEDARFCRHRGVDWGALREVVEDEEGPSRGASTVPMQVAKNLFLWQGSGALRKVLDPIRKLFEFPLAMWIDLMLPKQRILEIYLNIAELGPSGQFGAEAGAAYAFGHSAANLTPREAALLASILPNPVKRSARTPGPGVRRLAGTYTARANVVATCWNEKRGF